MLSLIRRDGFSIKRNEHIVLPVIRAMQQSSCRLLTRKIVCWNRRICEQQELRINLWSKTKLPRLFRENQRESINEGSEDTSVLWPTKNCNIIAFDCKCNEIRRPMHPTAKLLPHVGRTVS